MAVSAIDFEELMRDADRYANYVERVAKEDAYADRRCLAETIDHIGSHDDEVDKACRLAELCMARGVGRLLLRHATGEADDGAAAREGHVLADGMGCGLGFLLSAADSHVRGIGILGSPSVVFVPTARPHELDHGLFLLADDGFVDRDGSTRAGRLSRLEMVTPQEASSYVQAFDRGLDDFLEGFFDYVAGVVRDDAA